MRVLIAPNAFKGALTASAAAEAIAQGLKRSLPQCECELFPVGDGGDGTCALLIDRLLGRKVTVEVRDPLDRPITATFGLINKEQMAVIELAEASGLRRLRRDELNPLRATTFGTGELLRAALAEGVKRIVLAIGGSATVDGGMGILQALGMRFLAASGAELAPGPENLATLASIDISGLDARVGGSELTILCDVDNPLLGERGAARVFGPQKGASPGDVEKLEHALGQFRQVIQRQTGKDVASMPGGGAAGGVAAGLYALLKAKLVKGADYFLDATRFDEALAKSDLVITGEGRLDAQTLQGKAPMGVALRARRRAIRVVALAGRIDSKAVPDLRSYFDQAREITPPSIPMGEALTQTAQSLERAAFELGKSLLQT